MVDNNQLKAIKSDSGPALILAGPGSGKTTVLTHHIKHLTENGVSPDKILVITFTRKAASEMRSRFENLSPTAVHQIVFGTFHSVFFKIINSFGRTEKRLIKPEERESFLLTVAGDGAASEYYGNHISFYKSLNDKNEYRFVNDTERSEFMRVLGEYNKWLESEGCIDYDDIIEACYELLKNKKKAVKYLNEKFSHILVDEFQDINSIQYETLKLIAGTQGIIYAVGDEDQSIYGFRGATPDIMKRFLTDFPNTTVINLNRNYRSFQDISDFSQKVIIKNPGRLRTDIPECRKRDDGTHVHLKVFKERSEEMAEFLRDCKELDTDKKTAACLVRTNKEVYEYRKLLGTDPGDANGFKIAVINDYLAYADYVLNRDIESLKKIIVLSVKGIPTSLLNDCESLAAIKKKFRGTGKGDVLSVFETQLRVIEGLNPFSFAMYLRNIVGLYGVHKEEAGVLGVEALDGVYGEIMELSQRCKSIAEFKEELLSIRPAEIKSSFAAKSNLLITTFHQAKGLEFDYVFIPDAVEGKIPAGMSVAECRVEEERRLFYVALTRAKEELFVYTIKNEESGGTLPSRFLEGLYY